MVAASNERGLPTAGPVTLQVYRIARQTTNLQDEVRLLGGVLTGGSADAGRKRYTINEHMASEVSGAGGQNGNCDHQSDQLAQTPNLKARSPTRRLYEASLQAEG